MSSIIENEASIRISPYDSQKQRKNIQYFRYKNAQREQQAWLLLERENLTTDEIIQFCNDIEEFPLEETNAQQLAYRTRRQELRRLLTALDSSGTTTGGAFIDRQGRLVPIQDGENQGPPLPPLPDLNPNRNNVNGEEEAPARNNNPPRLDHHQEATDAIERALERYRQEGVREDDLQLIRLEIPNDPLVNPLTMRRILIAVAAVVLAYVSMLIQTLTQPTAPVFSAEDPLPSVILHQRGFAEHLVACGTLTNRSRGVSSTKWFLQTPVTDCSDGVLMIPSVQHLTQSSQKARNEAVEVNDWGTKQNTLHPEIINSTWWMDCGNETQGDNVCLDRTACFRGVHDSVVDDHDVRNAMRLGKDLINHHGTDHLDIHTDTSLLQAKIPNIVARLEHLLLNQYGITSFVKPVAFRVYAAGSITGDGVRSSHLSSLLNHSNYRRWTEHAARQNRLARKFPIPWPLTVFKPVRDACHLMADREVDDKFHIHTSVLLSDSASDGMTLFVDEVEDWVTRGLAVESTVGRVIVSTTGSENRRCRLPTRSGIRAALQIWWTLGDRR